MFWYAPFPHSIADFVLEMAKFWPGMSWHLPVSLFCISLSWWENYVDAWIMPARVATALANLKYRLKKKRNNVNFLSRYCFFMRPRISMYIYVGGFARPPVTRSRQLALSFIWWPCLLRHGLRRCLQRLISLVCEKNVRQRGIEPRSIAWKATMLTITPLTLSEKDMFWSR